MSGARYAQFCALARAAEIVGERWTLLIVRELLLGPKRFSDLAERLGGVSPTLLTARLASLTEHGLVRRAPQPPLNVLAYELTPTGAALKPAIYALIRWGGRFLFPMRPDEAFDPDWVMLGLDAVARTDATAEVRIGLTIRHQDKAARFLVEGGPAGTRLSRSDAPATAEVDTSFDVVLRLIAGELSLADAAAKGMVVVTGATDHAEALPLLFELSHRSSGLALP